MILYPNSIIVKPIETETELDAVHKLTYETFRQRGLCKLQPDGRLRNNLHLDEHPNTKIFIALKGKELLGTLSYTACGHKEDIYNFDLFSDLLEDQVLNDGTGFSGWRLAVKPSFSMQPLVAMILIHGVMEYALTQATNRAFFSVMASNYDVYKKMLRNATYLGARHKMTPAIDGKLCFFQLDIQKEDCDLLAKKIEIFSRWRSGRDTPPYLRKKGPVG